MILAIEWDEKKNITKVVLTILSILPLILKVTPSFCNITLYLNQK